jgi:hypothetical protein
MKRKALIIALSMACFIQNKAIFGMHTLISSIAELTITGEKQNCNEWGHSHGYRHELINPEGKAVLECFTRSDLAPVELVEKVLDENGKVLYGWKIRSTFLGYK